MRGLMINVYIKGIMLHDNLKPCDHYHVLVCSLCKVCMKGMLYIREILHGQECMHIRTERDV